MSNNTYWADARATPRLVDDDFHDNFGTGIRMGRVGVEVGEVVIEGTRDEIRALGQELIDLFDADSPAFEYLVEYDPSPAHHYYDQATADLEEAGAAPVVMSDVKQRAEHLAEGEAEPSEVSLLCPYGDCLSVDTIVEVDSSIRWNDISIELNADRGEVTVSASTGRDGDSEFDHFLCTGCQREVSAPPDFEIESYD